MTGIDLLKRGLDELDLHCTGDQTESFLRYMAELKKWNKTYNLTALTDEHDIIVKHFLDSLTYLKAVPQGRADLADAGSGAGFPGIPLKIVRPDLNITLFEPSRKKVAFLKNIARCLNLDNIHIVNQRMPASPSASGRTYDIIISRATFSLADFLAAACPHLRDTGILIASKGPRMEQEVKALSSSELYKQSVKEVLNVSLPTTSARRNLVILSCTMKR